MIALLASSTPAAPQAIVGWAWGWQADLAFWLYRSEAGERIKQALLFQKSPNKSQEKQRDRDARVARIEIYPGDVTVQADEHVAFTAAAFDSNGNPVGGVRIKWSCQDEGRGAPARVSQRGDFVAAFSGRFKVTAETESGKRAQVHVTVTDGAGRRKDDRPSRTREVSSRDLPPVAAALPGKQSAEQSDAHASGSRRTKTDSVVPVAANATSAAMPLPGDGWDGTNYWSADDPDNTRGNPPGSAEDGGAGNGNFQIAAPLLSLPGRGIDIGLGLAYNSRVWNKAGSQITFDIDRDWPAPGWSLGFGKLVGLGVNNGSMIVDADGTRHSYTGTVVYGPNQNYTDFTGHTTDGTFIDYTHHTGIGGAIVYAQAKYPNGTVIDYGAGNGHVYPTRITDSNGNYITITYVNNQGPRIQTVTDTLGRFINFYYDSNNLLTAITAPALGGTGTRTLVRLHYTQLSLGYSFSGLTPVVHDPAPWTIDSIYYPATNTGYWFGDTDSYSSYGMLAKVIEQRGMGFSASSLNEQGTVTPGLMTRQEVYGFQYTGLTDAPTFTSMTETWTRDGVNTDQAVTNYEVNQNSTPRTVTVTLPNGTKSTQLSYNAPGQYNNGLVYHDETRDSTGHLLQSSTAAWEPGAYDSPRPTRVEATDELGQTTATEFSYGTLYNQVTETRDYDYGGQTLLRAMRRQYQNSSSYTGRHIFNLPTVVEIYAGDNTTRVSRAEYQYDGQTLTDTPGVVMHNDASNPYAPVYTRPGDCETVCDDFCHLVCGSDIVVSDYDPSTDYRGNVTLVKSYADALSLNNATAVTETRLYDITGNMVTASTSCCQQTTVNYSSATQYAYPLSQTRGSSDPNSPIHVTSSATYDFNTGLALTATDANGRTAQTNYYADTLRPQTIYSPTGAYLSYEYDEAAMSLTETIRMADGTIAGQSVKLLNGRGHVRREKALGANNVWDMVDVQYDALGQVTQQSLPYRSGDTVQWSTTAYDALGRVTSTQAPDGSTTQVFYNEGSRPSVASNAPGQTTRVVDPWGRERWGRADAGNRLVEVVEPDPNGNGAVTTNGLVTTYGYDTLGNLTNAWQDVQTRSFRYDSLGRLTHQKLAERLPTLNDNGQFVTSGGTWSDVFSYDDRSNVTARVDARGVKTIFSYNDDPLNRVQSVSFDTTGFGDTAHPILAAPSISYAYVTTGDITRLSSVTTANVSTDSFGYDSEGRVASRTLTLQNRTAYPMVSEYVYDTLDRVTDVRYPAEYGTGAAPRKVVHQDYDIEGRLSGLKMDGTDYASQIAYNAASQPLSLKVGASGANQITESYGYGAQTGLMESQTVTRGASTLLNLSYDYAGANGKRTGQLVKLTNNLDASHRKDRNYRYDALGRLAQATGGTTASPIWTESYSYDRFGNRLSVTSSGNTAKLEKPVDPKVKLPTTELAMKDRPGKPDDLFLSHSKTSDSRAGARRAEGGDAENSGATASTIASPAPAPQSTPTFTDDPLVAGVTPIKALHITELRDAINQLRSRAGLQAATWTDNPLTGGVTGIKAAHVTELRARLNEARTALGLSNPVYTDPTLTAGGTTIKAAHIQELRDRVKSAWTTAQSVPRDGIASLSYDAATNRITTTGYEYDAAGNQTRVVHEGNQVQRYQYDAAGRLINVLTDNNTLIASYSYGSSRQRLSTTEGNLKTYYVWGATATMAEYTEENSSGVLFWSKSYVYLGTRLLATLQPNGNGTEYTQFHHPDRLGTRLITNAADASVQEQVSLPYGAALDAESTGSTNRRFTSYDRSVTTGLDYAVNRHYDSSQGRFTQVDPIGMAASSLGDPQTLNLYAYCGNDPVNRVDPDGLFWGKLFRFIGKVFKVLVVVAAAVAIFVGVLAVAGALAPIAGVGFGLLMFAAAAVGLLSVFGPPMLRRVISVGLQVLSIYSMRPGIIWNFASAGAGAGGGLSQWAVFAGAIGRFLQGIPATLNEKEQAKFTNAKDRLEKDALKDGSPCATYLASKGFSVEQVRDALSKQRPFSGERSTDITAFQAGISGRGIGDVSVRDFMKSGNASAATSIRRANPYDVYYFKSALNSTDILHETLHTLDFGDSQIYEKLTGKIVSDNEASKNISKELARHGCK
jgi:RHS repeat-associated protein